MSHQPIAVILRAENPSAREIAQLYWDYDENAGFTHTVKEIAETYGLTTRAVWTVANDTATALLMTRSCDRCQQPWRLQSRQELRGGVPYGYDRWGRWVCVDCRDELEAHERLVQDARMRERREQIVERYAVPQSPLLDVRALSLEHAVALLALIRTGADTALTRVRPLRDAEQPWAPRCDYGSDVLREMYGSVLWVDPHSPVDAFVREGTDFKYYPDRVAWRVAGPQGELDRVEHELELLFETKNWPDPWATAASTLQTALAAHELIAHLLACLDRHGLGFSPGAKTSEITTAIAEQLTIGQGHNLIWRATKDAAAHYLRTGCAKRKAAGYSIKRLRELFNGAIDGGWSIKPFERSSWVDESMIVDIFYREFLDVPDPMQALPPAPTQAGIKPHNAQPAVLLR